MIGVADVLCCSYCRCSRNRFSVMFDFFPNFVKHVIFKATFERDLAQPTWHWILDALGKCHSHLGWTKSVSGEGGPCGTGVFKRKVAHPTWEGILGIFAICHSHLGCNNICKCMFYKALSKWLKSLANLLKHASANGTWTWECTCDCDLILHRVTQHACTAVQAQRGGFRGSAQAADPGKIGLKFRSGLPAPQSGFSNFLSRFLASEVV